MKCIDIKSNAFRVPLLIWIVAVLVLVAVHPVKADSGIVTVTSTNDGTRNDNGNNGGNIDFNNILVDTNDFNTFQVITISSADFTGLGKLVDYTTFTITSGGSGTGVVSYVNNVTQNVRYISWFFDDGDTFGGNPTSNVHNLTLSYTNSSFFSGATLSSLGSCVSNYLSSTFPISMSCGAGKPLVATNAGATFTWQRVGTTTSANYSVSYLSNNRFTVNFTKSDGAVNTKGIFYNNSGFVYFPDTIGKINFDFVNTYTDGLLLNFSTSAAYKIYTINSSGVSVSPPVANSTTPYTGGSPSGQIYFDTNQNYYFGNFGINVSLSDVNYSNLNNYYIWTIAPNGNAVVGSPISFTSQTFSTGRNWGFTSIGVWNSTLTSCSKINIFCNLANGDPTATGIDAPTIYDTALDSINLPALTYKVTTDSSSYSTGQTMHINVSNPSSNTVYLNIFDPLGFSTTTFATNVQVQPNSLTHPFYYFNYTIPSTVLKGAYNVVLGTIPTGGGGGVAFTNFTIGTATPGSDILSIAWDSVDYVGGQNVLSWTANRNDSVVHITKYIFGNLTVVDNFTVPANGSGSQSYLLDVPGLWIANITDNKSSVVYSNLTVRQTSAVGGCVKTAPDYVCWDSSSYLRPANFVINFKGTNMPGVTNLNGYVIGSQTITVGVYDPDGIIQANATVYAPGFFVTVPYPLTNFWSGHFSTTAKTGIWTAKMISGGTFTNHFNDGTIIAQGTTLVIDVSPNTTVATGGQGQVGTPLGTIDGWTAMFGMGVNDTSRFLFAVIIIVLVTISGFILTGNNGTGGIVLGFVPYAFFTYINYVPKWFILVAIIIMGIKLRWFN